MSLKLIDNTGKIVDAVLEPCYVRYDGHLRMFLACSEEQAQGVASHDGSTYWHLSTRPDFGVDGYSTVSAISISDEEAKTIIAALDDGAEIEDISLYDSAPETQDGSSMSMGERLLEDNKRLREQVDFLTDCVLELSEAIFD